MDDLQFQRPIGPMTIHSQRHYDDHGQLIYTSHQFRDVDGRVVFTYDNPAPSMVTMQNSNDDAQQSIFGQFPDNQAIAALSLFDRRLSDQFYYNQLCYNARFFDPIYDRFSTRIESLFDHQFPDQFYYDMFLRTIESFFEYQFSDEFYYDHFYENECINPTYDMFLTMMGRILDHRFSETSDNDGLSEETIAKNLETSNCPKKEDELCAVCLDGLSQSDKKTIIGSLDCGHEYHEGCIKKWLMRKNCCPLCKATGIVCDEIYD